MSILKVPSSLVSVNWLHQNLEAKNLIIFDATMAKIGVKNNDNSVKKQLPKAVFFDIKNTFSEAKSQYPNTLLDETEFEFKAQNIGVNNDSCIVVYDDIGIYSSPRVWWMFKTFGFNNIAVLNGGLPAWKQAGFKTEIPKNNIISKGDFTANHQPTKMLETEQVLACLKQEVCIADARSEQRFLGLELEPRKEVKSGHIPNSINIPFTELLHDKKMKSVPELQSIFKDKNPHNNKMVFSCGSGITACILALGAELSGYNNYAVYDGSWTEWGSRRDLPIKETLQKTKWTKQEFQAYVLLYCAQSNFIETNEERAYVMSKVDEQLFNAIHTEIVHDTKEHSILKIKNHLIDNSYSLEEKDALLNDIKNVFFADGTVDKYEKNVFEILRKLFKKYLE